jgi:hypothetical protein
MATVEPCFDCGTTKSVSQYNSREVPLGFFRRLLTGQKVERRRFPGFLCVPCWMAANPVLFPNRLVEEIRYGEGNS